MGVSLYLVLLFYLTVFINVAYPSEKFLYIHTSKGFYRVIPHTQEPKPTLARNNQISSASSTHDLESTATNTTLDNNSFTSENSSFNHEETRKEILNDPTVWQLPQDKKEDVLEKQNIDQAINDNIKTAQSSLLKKYEERQEIENKYLGEYEKWLNFFIYSILVILLIWFIFFLVKNFRFNLLNKKNKILNIQEIQPLGNRQFLAVVEYGNKKVLLGISPGRIDFLCDLPLLGKFEKLLEEKIIDKTE
ncbi:MAG: flagellar biosynthetic protein FliO [Chthoniobacterales bacterium]|nr:flagellar biosynthetic protein FliO [Chthoniobacterales bacterium]